MISVLYNAFSVAVEAAQAKCLVPHLETLPLCSGKRVFLIAGKAAAAQTKVVEEVLGPLEGLCIIPEGQDVETSLCVIHATHPLPGEGSIRAAKSALELARSLTASDQLICLISGGASALMSAPLPGMAPNLKTAVHKALISSGASISELNTVRKQLSLIKGGRLAHESKAHIINLLISDVPGDREEFIASGPTVPATTCQADAIKILEKYKVKLLDELRPWLADPKNSTPKANNSCFNRVTTTIVAAPSESLKRAQIFLESQGIDVWILGDSIEGDSETVARVMAQIALWQRNHGELKRPLCLLSGGETTVKVTGHGIGGPNAHFALILLDELNREPGISAIVCDTDGIDGGAKIAGAFIDPDTLAKAQSVGVSCTDAILHQDSHTFFGKLNQSVISGPTGTNVNDFRAILIEPRDVD